MSAKKIENDQVAVVVGTRPGIIKMAPIIRTLSKRGTPHYIIHTGQHYSPEMDSIFMQELGLQSTVFRLESSETKITHGAKTAHMLQGIEEILLSQTPSLVLVCGDANTNLSGGLAARKLNLILGHVESGLRSYDWTMPEEHNRVMLDHISDLLFAPTLSSAENLKRENVRGEIHVTGNTVVDALMQHIKIAEHKSSIFSDLNLNASKYMLLTTHREENVDDQQRLTGILQGALHAARALNMTIVFPVHPRTKKRISEFRLDGRLEELKNENNIIIDPVGYFDFLMLLKNAALVLTDSGGIQEESCILGVKTVTLRDNSERPETIALGSNVLAGTDPEKIVDTVKKQMTNDNNAWDHPFGGGKAAERIVEITQNAIKNGVLLRSL